MKQMLFSLLLFAALPVFSQSKTSLSETPDPAKKLMVVDAACGMCKFGMQSNDCSLAVRIKGKTYFVDGTEIDDHGDAHAKHGFCMAVRKAEVQGDVVNNRFRATYFRVLPAGSRKSN